MDYNISKTSFLVEQESHVYVQCFSQKCIVGILEAMANSSLIKYLQSQLFFVSGYWHCLHPCKADKHFHYFLSLANALLLFYHYCCPLEKPSGMCSA